jgi:hypothetical protein
VTPDLAAAQRQLLALVLDVLVPAGDGFPAGAAALDHVAARAAASPDLERLLYDGLPAVEEAARSEHAAGFAALSDERREHVLRRVEQSHAAFFEALVRHTYDGYYSHPAVVARLGLEAGPLHPRGHQLEAADLPDLARVTARGAIYRQT